MPLKPEKENRIRLLLDEGDLTVSEIARKLKVKIKTIEAFTTSGQTSTATRITRLTDERNALKKQNKELLRENGLFVALAEEIREKVKPIAPFNQSLGSSQSNRHIKILKAIDLMRFDYTICMFVRKV